MPEFHLVDGISIIAPAPGMLFQSGSRIPIVVAPINGFRPQDILVVCRIGASEVDPLWLQTTLEIPADAIGPLDIGVLAKDEHQNIAQAEVTVQVRPAANLTGIMIDPSPVELNEFGPTQSLYVIGHYQDGVDRDITHPAVGTTYESSNKNVARVSLFGVVTSAGFGTCVVTATNGGLRASTTINVTGLPCVGDIVENDLVDIDDFRLVIGSWGSCYACGADIDGSGEVDLADLLQVLFEWGPCRQLPQHRRN